MKLYTLFIIVFVLFTFALGDVRAQSFDAIDHKVRIEILESGDALYNAEVILKNNEFDQIIRGYEYILPSINPELVTVSIDDNIVDAPVYKYQEEDYSAVDAYFSGYVIKPGEQKKLTITATLPKFINERYSTKYLLLKASGDRTFDYKVHYPKSFGLPVFLSSKNFQLSEYNENTLEINFLDIQPTFIIWGNEYYVDIESRLILNNPDKREATSFFQLLSNNSSQEVNYKQVLSGEFGLEDQYNNRFAFINTKGNSKIEAGYEARIRKTVKQLDFNIDKKYDLNWPEDNKVVKDIESIIENNEEPFQIIKKANNRLITNYPVEFTSSPIFEYSEKHWQYLDTKKFFNSFDYCYVLTSLIEKVGGKAEIRYGYVLINNFNETLLQPHFWLIAEINEEIFIVDPFQQIISGLEYFGAENDFDRLTVGTWHPDIETYGALGLFSNQKDAPVKKVRITEFNSVLGLNNTIDATAINTDDINYSGFYYSDDITINNQTPNFLTVDNIRVNGWKKDLGFIPEGYTLGLLPGKNNNITISGIRNLNFFYSGEREDVISLNLNDNQKESIDVKVVNSFIISPIIFFLIPVMVLIILMIGYLTRKRWMLILKK